MNMNFFQRTALWIFLKRIRTQLIWLNNYEKTAFNKRQFLMLHKAYIRLLESIKEMVEWGTNLCPIIDYNMIVLYIESKLQSIERKAHANT